VRDRVKGVFAAVPTPIDDSGRLNEPLLERLVNFVVDAGVQGVCIGGATGEYPHFEVAERIQIIRRAAASLPAGAVLLVGIGSSSVRRTIELGEAALAAGARALLLPMPMFFRYAQPDLHAYCAEVSRTLRAPCWLYDLPDFTNPLAIETSLSLLRGEPFITGIKDSSGREQHLAALADARGDLDWTLLVGDDRLLLAGLRAGWDGGISGIAACCPELLVALHRSVADGRREEAAQLQRSIDEIAGRLAPFPTPWAIRIGLAGRGFDTGPLPLPLTDARRQQLDGFQQWFSTWRLGVDAGHGIP
jgi:4-hydroxy-tetrahydrodipicolinate synthase